MEHKKTLAAQLAEGRPAVRFNGLLEAWGVGSNLRGKNKVFDSELRAQDFFRALKPAERFLLSEGGLVLQENGQGVMRRVVQGEVGDCYILATMSSMAEIPPRIEDLFETKEVNRAGIYMMYFYINGVKTPVIVDDYLPSKNGRCGFAKGKSGELWVSLLEKGWAKLHGTYARMAGGLPSMAAVHLSGTPSTSYDHDDYKNDRRLFEKLFEIIDDADDKNYSIMACSPGQGEGDLGTGIAAGHAYSVVEIWKVNTNRGVERLLKIRNPWGRVEWKGDWSDNSSLWTP